MTTDYSRYILTRRQYVWALCFGCIISAAGMWILCRHSVAALACAPAGWLYPRFYRDRRCRMRKTKLRMQFKEMLQVLSSLLSAGRSVENAFYSLEGELVMLLGEARTDLLHEVRILTNRMRNGEPLESLLTDFAARSDLEEVRNFAEAFSISKRAGGDLVEIVRRTSQIIAETLEVEMEVSVLLSQKRFESRIMMAMPFAFIGFLGFFAPDYMAPLHQGFGWIVLAVCLLSLAACCWWMVRTMDIEV
ncbi:pilus assembly protein TadB [Cohnella pontilimi]|uniref:Pilus assembly protein TadB n=1 Tax=Cohnella pontilimi TaxID=2564100 RepID=A0A4U0F8G6_9BACL|nr:type II secretion system F family protein [Cohnella pontilimi]TJY40921.1 pilus assembly protein TadB [Cohnella pontilimi]